MKRINNLELEYRIMKLEHSLYQRDKTAKRSYRTTFESKKDLDILRQHLGDEYFNKYIAIKNRIKDPEYKDVYKMIKVDPDEIYKFIDSFTSASNKRRNDKSGAKLLFEDDDWKVYRITTYDAAKYYGKNTKWCISGNFKGHEEEGEAHFNEYLEDSDGGFYFYINKHDPSDKWCIIRDHYGAIYLIYDAEDNVYISISQLEKMGVSLPLT